MSFVTPPIFRRPDGDPQALMSIAQQLAGIAALTDNIDMNDLKTAPSIGIGRNFEWTGHAANSSGLAMLAAIDRLDNAALHIAEAATAVAELALITAAAQAAVDRIQQAAFHTARAASADPMMGMQFNLFTEHYSMVSTAESIVAEHQTRVAAKLNALAQDAPHYTAPPTGEGFKASVKSGWARATAAISDAASSVGRFASRNYDTMSDWGHGAMDGLGLVPGFGEPVDLLNAGWYGLEGDYTNMGLAAGSAIPIGGYGFSAAKAGRRIDDMVDAGDTASDAVRGGRRVDPADNPSDAGYNRNPDTSPRPDTDDVVDPPFGPQPNPASGTRTGFDPEPVETPPMTLDEALRRQGAHMRTPNRPSTPDADG